MEKLKQIMRILKKKHSERTIIEKTILYDWFALPVRIIIFPIMLIVRLFKWTYYYED